MQRNSKSDSKYMDFIKRTNNKITYNYACYLKLKKIYIINIFILVLNLERRNDRANKLQDIYSATKLC